MCGWRCVHSLKTWEVHLIDSRKQRFSSKLYEAQKESLLPENENDGVERVDKDSDDATVCFIHQVWPVLVFVFWVVSSSGVCVLDGGWCPVLVFAFWVVSSSGICVLDGGWCPVLVFVFWTVGGVQFWCLCSGRWVVSSSGVCVLGGVQPCVGVLDVTLLLDPCHLCF